MFAGSSWFVSPSHRVLSALVVAMLGGCGTEPGTDAGGSGDGGNVEAEVITAVTLSFTPQGLGGPVTARFSDPDGDGGMSGSAEPITLMNNETYNVSIAFSNELADPPDDITQEIIEEAEEHQLFITGMGVSGPATADDPSALAMHAYGDTESNYGPNAQGDDLPVGLMNTITTLAAGTGTLQVQLYHLPPLNGAPQKVAGLAEQLAMGMALPGDVDASVTFDLTVQ